jgi:hypothetical protein
VVTENLAHDLFGQTLRNTVALNEEKVVHILTKYIDTKNGEMGKSVKRTLKITEYGLSSATGTAIRRKNILSKSLHKPIV